jgi:L-alanine-DL-glutamate epimerase-like enolase superfamily enzyme
MAGDGPRGTQPRPARSCVLRDLGIPRVKIKIGESWGTEPARDRARIDFARRVIGPDAELYVDANGGYTRKQARSARSIRSAR